PKRCPGLDRRPLLGLREQMNVRAVDARALECASLGHDIEGIDLVVARGAALPVAQAIVLDECQRERAGRAPDRHGPGTHEPGTPRNDDQEVAGELVWMPRVG